MATLKMADGRELTVLHVGRGLQYAILHIYTNELTPAEAFEIFDNRPEATKELTYTETVSTTTTGEDGKPTTREEQRTTVFNRFTEMTAVNKSRYGGVENAIMIRMQRPFDD